MAFSIDFDRRPYNTLGLPCECVITFQIGRGATPSCYYSSENAVDETDKLVYPGVAGHALIMTFCMVVSQVHTLSSLYVTHSGRVRCAVVRYVSVRVNHGVV